MKVYCGNCKWFHGGFGALGVGHNCCSPSNIQIKHNYETSWSQIKKQAKEINVNNKCKNYNRKWWKFWVKED